MALLSASSDLPNEITRYASSDGDNQRTIQETAKAVGKTFQSISEILRFLAIILEDEQPTNRADELICQSSHVGSASDRDLSQRLFNAR